jgi:hypothetical protein
LFKGTEMWILTWECPTRNTRKYIPQKRGERSPPPNMPQCSHNQFPFPFPYDPNYFPPIRFPWFYPLSQPYPYRYAPPHMPPLTRPPPLMSIMTKPPVNWIVRPLPCINTHPNPNHLGLTINILNNESVYLEFSRPSTVLSCPIPVRITNRNVTKLQLSTKQANTANLTNVKIDTCTTKYDFGPSVLLANTMSLLPKIDEVRCFYPWGESWCGRLHRKMATRLNYQRSSPCPWISFYL